MLVFLKISFSGVDMLMKAVGKDSTSMFSILYLNFLPFSDFFRSCLNASCDFLDWRLSYSIQRFWLLVFPTWISLKEPFFPFLLVKSFICRSYNLQAVPTPRKSVPKCCASGKMVLLLVFVLLIREIKKNKK